MSGRVRCILAPAALDDVSRGIDGTPLRRVHLQEQIGCAVDNDQFGIGYGDRSIG